MKRYGFKFYRVGGADAEAAGLRYLPLIAGFAGGTISSFFLKFPSEAYLISLLYAGLGFGAEYYPKVFGKLIEWVALFSLVAFVTYANFLNGDCLHDYRNYLRGCSDPRHTYTAGIVIFSIIIYAAFSIFIAWLAKVEGSQRVS